jgi:hypothetical protein
MTTATTERITISATNVQPQSCAIVAPSWLGLIVGASSTGAGTITPTATGVAQVIVGCKDFRNNAVTFSDSITVYLKPTVVPDISGTVPVQVGDSIDVSYDSTNTAKIDVACSNCGSFATLARVSANALRISAKILPVDTVHRAICFMVHGLDGRYQQQQCVGLTIIPPQVALYSVPTAVRAAEVVPLHTVLVSTFDSTGQSTHPDFMRVNAPWSGGACWMSFTPYFASNGSIENPSLATSSDCEHWAPAPGVPSPIVAKPSNGYNSDPELLYDAKRACLGVVFRQVTSVNSINITYTCNGTTFTPSRTLFSAPNHSAVSPTVTAGADGVNRMFYVDAGTAGCNTVSSTVKVRNATTDTAGLDAIQFGAEVTTDLAQPGFVIWHIKVRYVPALKQYIAMYVAFPQTTGIGDCTDDDLYIATSADGLHWKSFRAPMLNHLDKRFPFTSLYRSSFIYDAATDQLRTIASALTGANWGEYGVAHNFTALIGALNSSATVAASQLVPSPLLVRKPDLNVKRVIMEDRP